MKILFIFMDGVGLGVDDPQVNPFAAARLPCLDRLLDGEKLLSDGIDSPDVRSLTIHQNDRASLLPLDACMGVDGLPQSASGQAALLTGRNVPGLLGYHEGPKPSPQIMSILQQDTLFSCFDHSGQAALLNAYPPRYFTSLESGYRLPGVIAMSAIYAGIKLKTKADLANGAALSADFTAQGWHDHLGITDIPVISPEIAGAQLGTLSGKYNLAFFEYWLTDYAGHHQDMPAACVLLEQFDRVLGSLLSQWEDEAGLILVTSDHGNLEDLSTRHHTRNEVPLLLVGSTGLRQQFINELDQSRGTRDHYNLADITPAILKLL